MRQTCDKTDKFIKAVLDYHDRSQRLRSPSQRARWQSEFEATEAAYWVTSMKRGTRPVTAYNSWCARVSATGILAVKS